MNTPTIRAVSNYVLFFFSVLSALVLVGCASTPKPPPLPEMSQLQVREMQTRLYPDVTEGATLKALMAALLDEGYIIGTVQPELGVVTAAKELYEVDEKTKSIAEFNYGSGSGTYQTTKRFEASALVDKHGDSVRVRINIIAKAVSNAGGNIWSQPVYDAETYQRLFSKINKAVFLEKEDL